MRSIIKYLMISYSLLMLNAVVWGQKSITINFENSFQGSIMTQYVNQGIQLSQSAQLINVPVRYQGRKTHSGQMACISNDLSKEFDPSPLAIKFFKDVSRVTFYTGIPNPVNVPVKMTVRVYEKNAGLMFEKTVSLNGSSDISTLVDIQAPGGKKIGQIDIYNESSRFEIIDDLTYWYLGQESTAPTTVPEVKITNIMPKGNGRYSIFGYIKGQGLDPNLSPAKMTVIRKTAPNSTTPATFETDLTIGYGLAWENNNPASNQLKFAVQDYEIGFFGSILVRVSMANAAGTGKDEKTVENMPVSIQNRYQQELSKGRNFGKFVWGSVSGDCKFVIYENGAIFDSGQVYALFGKIFQKWKSHADASSNWLGLLGCPTSEELKVAGHRWGDVVGSSVNIDDATRQDFVNGRIYSGPKGTFYVLKVFVDAIDALDFDVTYGLPTSDPVYQPAVPYAAYGLPVYWQRFETTNDPDYYKIDYSVIEMTANPPTLWIATPNLLGWLSTQTRFDMTWANKGLTTSQVQEDLDYGKRDQSKNLMRLPTVWRKYTCSDVNGPCNNVGKNPSAGVVPQNRQTTQRVKDACFNEDYDSGEFASNLFGVGNRPYQWEKLMGNMLTPALGTVKKINIAGTDNPLNHYCLTGLSSAGVDVNIRVVPNSGYESILGGHQDGYHSGEGGGTISHSYEIEYEWCLTGYPEPVDPSDAWGKGPKKDIVQNGDLLFVAGRWISDCGHAPYQTEIHPPAFMLNMFSKTETGQKETIGDMIYADWWYPNQVVEVDVYPPPRPGADYIITANYSVWDGSNLTYEVKDFNRLHIIAKGRKDVPPDLAPFLNPPLEPDGQLLSGKAVLMPFMMAKYPELMISGTSLSMDLTELIPGFDPDKLMPAKGEVRVGWSKAFK